MIKIPSVKSNYKIEVLTDECIFLLSENQKYLIEGKNLCTVFSMIDGFRTAEDIATLLQNRIPIEDTFASIELLEIDGHLEEANDIIPKNLKAFWAELGVEAGKLQSLLSTTTIEVIGIDGVNIESTIQLLKYFGLNVASKGNLLKGNLLIVLCEDYLSPQLEQVNDRCISENIPWMLIKPTGLNIWIGPVFIPGKTQCLKCLQFRLVRNREVEAYIESNLNYKVPIKQSLATIMPTELTAINMAIIQFMRWLALGTFDIENSILILDSLSLNSTIHKIVKRPQCKKCGDPELGKIGGKSIEFQNRNLISTKNGGLRVASPEETFSKYSHHVSPITGIIKNIVQSPWNDESPMKNYSSGQNLAMIRNNSLLDFKSSLRSLSGGKGKTDWEAKIGALCEGIERYSGLFHGEEEIVQTTYNEIKNEAIHPNECMLYSEQQYLERGKLQNKGEKFYFTPLPFDKNFKIAWSPVYSYTKKKVKYLPTSYLYFNYPSTPANFFSSGDSNGNAAGTSIEDACLQGLFEIIERDSVAIWWYNRIKRPKVNLDSLKDPYVGELIEFYRKFNREFWVLDLTTDTNIPSFVSISYRTTGPSQDIVLGFGAHLDARIAINRAITEMNQFMPNILNPQPNSETNYDNFSKKELINWLMKATIENQDYLIPDSIKAKNIEEYESLNQNDILSYLNKCISSLESLGMEILILNQTRPDIGLPVVKMIVPGMRHWWRRFAPGRLYDTPLKLGWISKKKTEIELNPIPIVF